MIARIRQVVLLFVVQAFAANEDLEFTSHGVVLSGTLVMPQDQPVRVRGTV